MTASPIAPRRRYHSASRLQCWPYCREASAHWETAAMAANLFWFNDEQWAKIVPHLPSNQPGPKRKDDRRILSGIMHVLKIGCHWQDCPKEYGPHKTISTPFSRWSERGVWQKIFHALLALAT